MDQRIQNIIDALSELMDDNSVPKNVKTKISNAIILLKDNTDISVKVNKVLHELDEISDDTHMQTYTRTQVWNIVSLLEMIQ